jgi:hypothetical protein
MRTLGLALYAVDLAIAAGLILIGVAHADPAMAYGTVCDTQEQAERYVQVLRGDETELAIGKVNAEYGSKDACATWAVMFIPDGEVAQVSNAYGRYRIVRIIVVAAPSPMGMKPLPPKPFFAIARMPGFEI